MDANLIKLKEEWETKLTNAKDDRECKIAEKRLKKINDEIALAGFDELEGNTTPAPPTLGGDNPLASFEKGGIIVVDAEKLAKLEEERERLLDVLNFWDNEEDRSRLAAVEREIEVVKQGEILNQVQNDSRGIEDVVWFESEVLNERFSWNKTKGILVFESGAEYTEAEVQELFEKGTLAEALRIIHELKRDFKAEVSQLNLSFRGVYA